MPTITASDVSKCIKKYKLNMKIFRFTKKDLLKGMKVELEHGTRFELTNITDDNIYPTFKIALAHLYEFPDYYDRLEKMENTADLFWKNKNKLKITKL